MGYLSVDNFLRLLFFEHSSSEMQTGRSVVDQEATNLPQVLVISGLETTLPSMQRALLNVILENHVVLDEHQLKLPEDFLIVCLCPNDIFEKPHIHDSLVSDNLSKINVLT